jgi:hypothetical protein
MSAPATRVRTLQSVEMAQLGSKSGGVLGRFGLKSRYLKIKDPLPQIVASYSDYP